MNPAAATMFEYPAAEVIGQNIKVLMPQPYCAEHDGYLSNYCDTGKAQITGNWPRSGGAAQGWHHVFPWNCRSRRCG